MPSVEQTVRGYAELAQDYGTLGDEPMRDRFLVLAADALLAAGKADEAEGLRQKLLQSNPHHLLKPYHSLTEAMKSADVRNYVAGLRRSYPPERIGQLLETAKRDRAARGPHPGATAGSAPVHPNAESATLRIQDSPPLGAARPPAPPAPAAPLRPPTQTIPSPGAAGVYRMEPLQRSPSSPYAAGAPGAPAGSWVCLVLFWLVLLLAIAWAVASLGKPFLPF